MASPPHLPPIQTFQPLSSSGSFTPPPYLVHENNIPESPIASSAMELSNSTMLAPPPPAAASAFREELLDGAADRRDSQAPAAPQSQSEDQDGEDGSGGEDDDEDDDEDDGDDGQQEPSFGWHHIDEDQSIPCDDELKYIESKEEHSALDHAYWEKETFFALNDPSLIPGESGRIDWLVEHFNGTKESPNKDLIMKSPVVQIGGYEWQIKFYPKGNRTDYLSVYLENVTMLNPDFKDRSELSSPALPVLAGSSSKTTQRNSVAAQVSVVMYNPAEPRVYEAKTDAHQYHKKAADFGWKYFTRSARPEFPLRAHGQRQAILRGDKLAFSAYVRIIDDPTGCMWDTSFPSTDASLSATGLRPFDSLSAQIAAVVPLLHLRPFRDLLYKHKSDSPLFILLQTCLDKILCRRLKRKHLKYSTLPDGCDVVEIWQKLSAQLKAECSPDILSSFDDLFGDFSPLNLPLCDKRLSTKTCSSVQEALNAVKPTSNKTPAILTVELERQHFNKSKRKWEKVTNSVDLNDHVEYNGVSYSLYAFVNHSGPLGTNNYTPLVRPGGPGYGWYAYDACIVRCLTQKQATKPASLRSPPTYNGTEFGYQRAPLADPADKDAVPYLAMYVRDDISAYTFALPDEEKWEVPEAVRKPRRALDGANGGDHPIRATRDSEKSNTSAANVIDFGASINGAIPRLSENQQHPGSSEPDQGAMDGDDVVMSDVEEDGSHTPVQVNTTLDAAANGITVEKREYRDHPEPPKPTRSITVNFFSGDYYQGSTLLEDTVYHGQGHMIHTNGDEYKGEFVDGLPSGKGTMTYATSGNIYTGDWLEGKHHGQGIYTELATGNVFEGGWKEGKRSGQFVLRGIVTDEDKGRCQICYEKDMTTAFYECGHVLACKECAAQIETCPVCRKRVLARLELYGVKVSME
ncbi:hypothetical protein Q7P37_005073 [Cladosporium fusiforme]